MTKTVMVLTSGTTSDWAPVVDMFKARGWEVLTDKNLTEIFTIGEDLKRKIDLVCFCGGSDVSPELYGEENTYSYCDHVRDHYEKEIYEACVEKIPLVGICRGGQFLNVMNGGKMIQHIEGHSMGDRQIYFWPDEHKKGFIIREDHHQGIIPSDEGEPLAWDCIDDNVEVVWYEKTKSLCFQPHPEWDHKPTEDLFFDLIEEYL